MKKAFGLILVVAALCIWAAISGSADSMMVGQMKLISPDIEIDFQGGHLVATHKATFTNVSRVPLPAGQIRLDSLNAPTISVDLAEGKHMSPKRAVASGGVTIDAHDMKVTKGQSPVLQRIHGSSKTATMESNDNLVTLTGNVVVTVTEAGSSEPLQTIRGDKVICMLKENKFRILGTEDAPAEVTSPLEENTKSPASQK